MLTTARWLPQQCYDLAKVLRMNQVCARACCMLVQIMLCATGLFPDLCIKSTLGDQM